jgi:hypothetical protein
MGYMTRIKAKDHGREFPFSGAAELSANAGHIPVRSCLRGEPIRTDCFLPDVSARGEKQAPARSETASPNSGR